MAKVVIEDIPGVNGSYDFNLDRFTNGELRLIKREANVRAGEIEEALQAGDNDVLVCFALIALKRAGRDIPPEALWEAEAGSITIDTADEEAEDDASPPETGPVSNESENGPTASSSPSSSGDGEASPEATTLSPTGSHG